MSFAKILPKKKHHKPGPGDHKHGHGHCHGHHHRPGHHRPGHGHKPPRRGPIGK